MPSSVAQEDLCGVDRKSLSKTLTVRLQKVPRKRSHGSSWCSCGHNIWFLRIAGAERQWSDRFLLLLGNTCQLEFITQRQYLTRIGAKWRHFRNTENSLPAYLHEMKGQEVLSLRPVENSPRRSGTQEGVESKSCCRCAVKANLCRQQKSDAVFQKMYRDKTHSSAVQSWLNRLDLLGGICLVWQEDKF